jgi:transcription antitermination factor NusG
MGFMDRLREMEVESYVPLVVRQLRPRRKAVECEIRRPAFNNYVFVRVGDERVDELKKVKGFMYYIQSAGEVVFLRDHIIEQIKTMELDGHFNSVNEEKNDMLELLRRKFKVRA